MSNPYPRIEGTNIGIKRELDSVDRLLLDALCRGSSIREIADEFGWSQDKVYKLIALTRRVLGAKSNAHAVAKYLDVKV